MVDTDFSAVFERFADLLQERFSQGAFTTEDALRYTLFLALIQRGFQHYRISLEEPLVGYAGREVDTVVHSDDGRPLVAFEFKYDRERRATQNRPQRAGAILRDIARLAHIHARQQPHAFFVYLTDAGMDSYLCNPAHRLDDLFSQQAGGKHVLTLEYFIKGRPPSLQRSLEGFGGPCEASCMLRRQLPGTHVLRIFSIIHMPDPVYNTD